MKNNLKWIFIVPIIFLMTACSKNTLSTSQTTYHADGMVAVVKGKTDPKAKLSYQINKQAQTKKVTNNDGSFAINVARSPQKQNIKIKSDYQQKQLYKTVQIAAAKPIMDYPEFAQKYNYLLLAQQQKPVLNSKLNNTITNIVNTPDQTVRINVQQQKLMAVTLIYPLKAMKTKAGVQNTSKSIATVSQLIGADGRDVLKQLAKQMRDAKKNQTSLKTITSHGKQFKLGVSSDKFYLYITE